MVLFMITVLGGFMLFAVLAFIRSELSDVEHSSSMNTSELKALLAAHKEMRKL